MVMRIIESQDRRSPPVDRPRSPVNDTNGRIIQKHSPARRQGHIHDRTQQRFDRADMAHHYDRCPGVADHQVIYEAYHPPLYVRQGLATGRCTGWIGFPTLMVYIIFRATSQDLGAL